MGLGALLNDARRYGAQIALFGHTHQACCVQEEDGLVVMNPGTCAVFGGSAGLIETDGKKYLNIHFNGYDKYILIKELQLKGKKRMRVEEFLRGFQIARKEGIILKIS